MTHIIDDRQSSVAVKKQLVAAGQQPVVLGRQSGVVREVAARYGDLIDMTYNQASRVHRLSMAQRAAQFMPFDALEDIKKDRTIRSK